MTACAQCRQRKVRCRGGPNKCDACTRLGFDCSLSSPITPSSESNSNLIAPRKRGKRACDACRAQRSRCSGEAPSCARCCRLNLPCHYSLSARQHRAKESRRRSTFDESTAPEYQSEPDNFVHSTPTDGHDSTAESQAISPRYQIDEHTGCEKALVKEHIDAYFDHIYPIPSFNFLHRADTLSRYFLGTLSPILLLSICGASSRFLTLSKEGRIRAKSWIERAERMLFHSLGKAATENVQALMILALYHGQNHQSCRVFHYLALASRMAMYLKLYRGDRTNPFVEAEMRRRIVWCIFTMDRLHAGGISEYILLPTACLQLQLPSPESDFEADTAVETPRLHQDDVEVANISVSALQIRLYDVRNRILQSDVSRSTARDKFTNGPDRYTKTLLDTPASPEQSIARFQSFEADLTNVYNTIPPELHFSLRTFQLRAFSPERTTFLSFHLYYHHCHCELYRLLNPGYREALPPAVIQSTSAELVKYAQAKCLEHAVAIGEIVASTYDLAGRTPYLTDASCFVVLYQASCAILYACHRDSPAYVMRADEARRYFTAFIRTLESLLQYFPRFTIYVNDIRNMLRSINEPNAPLPPQKATAERDFRARPISSDENSDEETGRTQTHATKRVDHRSGTILGTSLEQAHTLDTTTSVPDGAVPLPGEAASTNTLWWPHLEDFDTNDELPMDLDDGLLWDWANALESNFEV